MPKTQFWGGVSNLPFLLEAPTIVFVKDEALGVDPSQKQVAMDTLLKCLKETVKGNFIPAFLFVGGVAMLSHFEAIFQVQSMCPTPVAIGPKNIGKTTAVSTATRMLGMPSHFHIRDMTDVEASEQMVWKTFPSILDDPDDMKTVKKMLTTPSIALADRQPRRAVSRKLGTW